MLRHLPPTATPTPFWTLARGLHPRQDADDQFRRAFAAYVQADAAYTASSGRTALFLLLEALKAAAPARTDVALPAYTCPSLARVILDAGLTPRLVDISPRSMELDLARLAQAVGPQTLAVILVHPFGIPHPVHDAQEVAHRVGAFLIEDAAQSMGAQLDDRPVGAHGDFGLFSMGPGKPLSAGGGGIVTINQTVHNTAVAAELAAAFAQLPAPSPMANLTATGRLAAFTLAFQPQGWWLAMRAGAQKAGDDEANWGFRLTPLATAQASVALDQLPQLARYNADRRRRALTLMDAVSEQTEATIPRPVGRDQGAFYLRLPLLFANTETCTAAHDLLQRHGIGAGRMYKKTLADLLPPLKQGDYPGATQVAATLLTLPTHHHLRPREIDIIRTVFARRAATHPATSQ